MSTVIARITRDLILIIGVTFLFSVQAPAQRQRMSIEDRVKTLKDTLKLSDEQTAKITKILEDQREEITTAMSENRDDRSAMQTATKEIMQKANGQIKSVLNEDQAAKYDSMLKGRRARAMQRTRESGK